MGKSLEIYKLLKNDDSEKIYLFHTGNFFNFLNEDAELINKILGLTITNWGKDLIKCGFPNVALRNYLKDLKEEQINYQIIDNGKRITKEEEQDYIDKISIVTKNSEKDKKYTEIGKKIEELDLDNIAPKDLYKKIVEFQNKLKGENK